MNSPAELISELVKRGILKVESFYTPNDFILKSKFYLGQEYLCTLETSDFELIKETKHE